MTFEGIFGDPGAAPNVLEKRMLDFSQRTKAQNGKKLTFCNVTVSVKIGTLLGFNNFKLKSQGPIRGQHDISQPSILSTVRPEENDQRKTVRLRSNEQKSRFCTC